MSQIPDWMQTKENYIPSKDQEGFIQKSSLKLMGVLGKIRQEGLVVNKTADAQWKIFLTIYLIILCSCARNMFFVYLLLAVLLVRVCFSADVTVKKTVIPAVIAMAFSAVMLIPALFLGSPRTMLTVAVKVFFAAALVNHMAVTTPWNQVTDGMKFYHIPDMFIFTFDITLKYIVLLGDLAVSLLEALRIRSVGFNRNKKDSLSGVLGVTFLKSREMSGEMYDAMVCRGFEGDYRKPGRFRMTKWDILYLVAAILVTLLFIYFEYFA